MFSSPSGPPLGSDSQFCEGKVNKPDLDFALWDLNTLVRQTLSHTASMTDLSSIDPFGNGLLGISHGLQLASCILHLAS